MATPPPKPPRQAADEHDVSTALFALPFTLVVMLMTWALWRGVREDWQREAAGEPALRQRLCELVAAAATNEEAPRP